MTDDKVTFNLSVFSERLKAARKEKNWTQEKLAEESGVDQSSISSYERGNTVPTIDTMMSLSQALTKSLDWLCGIDDNPQLISASQWLRYLIELLEDPPTQQHVDIISLELEDPERARFGDLGMSIKCKHHDIYEFARSYLAIQSTKHAINKDTYDKFITELLKPLIPLFAPGYSQYIQGAPPPATPPTRLGGL